jgi:hypothetical protein
MTEMLDYMRNIGIPEEYFRDHEVDGFSTCKKGDLKYSSFDIMVKWIETQNYEKKISADLVEGKIYFIIIHVNNLYCINNCIKIQKYCGIKENYEVKEHLFFDFYSIYYHKMYGNNFVLLKDYDEDKIEFYELPDIPEVNPIK